MTKRACAILLSVMLAGASFGQTRLPKGASPQEQTRAIDPGSPVEVRFLDRSKLRGWISEVSESGFALSHEKMKHLEKSQIAFSQVKSVRQIKNVMPRHTVRNILIGFGIGMMAIGAIVGISIAHGLG